MYSNKIQRILKRKKISVGDRIKLVKKGKIFEGILMPRIDMGDQNCLTIKLDNGYNIGIEFEKGVNIQKIKTEWQLSGKKEKEIE